MRDGNFSCAGRMRTLVSSGCWEVLSAVGECVVCIAVARGDVRGVA